MDKSKYQNVSFSELCNYIKTNKYSDKSLKYIETFSAKEEKESELDSMGLTGYRAFSLEPSGIISALAFIENPSEYMLMTKADKINTLSNITTQLQTSTDILKNSHLNRKRKKVYDLIGNVYNGTQINEDQDIKDLFSCVSYIKNINFLLIKTNIQESIEKSIEISNSSHKGYVYFSSNPINWKRETPIYVIDYRCRWIAYQHAAANNSIHNHIAPWLLFTQGNGWTIEWPELDMTKTAIVAELSKEITYNPSDNSLLKDILSERLSKIKTLRVFTNWITKIDSDI